MHLKRRERESERESKPEAVVSHMFRKLGRLNRDVPQPSPGATQRSRYFQSALRCPELFRKAMEMAGSPATNRFVTSLCKASLRVVGSSRAPRRDSPVHTRFLSLFPSTSNPPSSPNPFPRCKLNCTQNIRLPSLPFPRETRVQPRILSPCSPPTVSSSRIRLWIRPSAAGRKPVPRFVNIERSEKGEKDKCEIIWIVSFVFNKK